MNGAEHYAEAERLLAQAAEREPKSGYPSPVHNALVARARAHADLAQVAALREIGDQLDTLPRSRPKTEPAPARCEATAVGGFRCDRPANHGGDHRYDTGEDE